MATYTCPSCDMSVNTSCGHCDAALVDDVLVLDSGAEESVSPPRFFPGPVVPSRMSKAGGSYRVANGHSVPNVGQ